MGGIIMTTTNLNRRLEQIMEAIKTLDGAGAELQVPSFITIKRDENGCLDEELCRCMAYILLSDPIKVAEIIKHANKLKRSDIDKKRIEELTSAIKLLDHSGKFIVETNDLCVSMVRDEYGYMNDESCENVAIAILENCKDVSSILDLANKIKSKEKDAKISELATAMEKMKISIPMTLDDILANTEGENFASIYLQAATAMVKTDHSAVDNILHVWQRGITIKTTILKSRRAISPFSGIDCMINKMRGIALEEYSDALAIEDKVDELNFALRKLIKERAISIYYTDEGMAPTIRPVPKPLTVELLSLTPIKISSAFYVTPFDEIQPGSILFETENYLVCKATKTKELRDNQEKFVTKIIGIANGNYSI